jgi:hypothetical protein
MHREVVEVGTKAGRRCDRLQDWRRCGGIQLLFSAAAATVEVPVLRRPFQVIGFAPIGPMMVPRKAESFKQVERAIHSRWGCARVLFSHSFNEFCTGRVSI